jgi:hypothetical protein
LAMSREKIFAEIAVADLKEAGVKPPKAPLEEKNGVDKTNSFNEDGSSSS